MTINPLIKRGRGRPKKPVMDLEANTKHLLIIEDLKTQIQVLEAAIKLKADPTQEIKELAEIIRIVQRAVKGLAADEDVFLGLINVKDIRERTRLEEAGLLSHSAMRLAGEKWSQLDLFTKIADMEDPYYISKDGEGRKEGILLQQAKAGNDKANLILNMPNTAGGPATDPNAPTQPKKSGFMSKFTPWKK
jgi:hypothetical protein